MMIKNIKCLFVVFLSLLFISIFAFFGAKVNFIKADNFDNVLLDSEYFGFDYDYLKSIYDFRDSDLNYQYNNLSIYYNNSVVFGNCTIYFNHSVYSSQYLEIFLVDNLSNAHPLFVYSEPLGAYILYVYLSYDNAVSYLLDDLPSTLNLFKLNLSTDYKNLLPIFKSYNSANFWVFFQNFDLTYFSADNVYTFELNGILEYPLYQNYLSYSTFDKIRIDTYHNQIELHFLLGDNQNTWLIVYDDNDGFVYDNARRLYLNNNKISLTLYNFIALTGYFNYVPSYEPSDITDLLFAYADIPYKITKSMTNFEIFGYSLFAIIGTCILVLVIIKVIKR